MLRSLSPIPAAVIQIDHGATLKLNGAAIDGGTINDNNMIDVTGASKIDSGATLNNGAVTVEPGDDADAGRHDGEWHRYHRQGHHRARRRAC